MVALTTLTLWSLGQSIVDHARGGTPPLRRSRRAPAAADPEPGTHSSSERTLATARRCRVERLGGGDGGLHRGQAQDPLPRRGQADLGGVADRAGARRRRVHDEPHLARRDEVEDRHLAGGLVGAPRRAWRPAGRRSRPPRAPAAFPASPPVDSRRRGQPGREPRQQGLVAVGDRQQRERAGLARAGAARARRPAAPSRARPADPRAGR